MIFGAIKTFSQTLNLKSGEFIGFLNIDVDTTLASTRFFDRSLLVLGLIRNILLAVILIFLYLTTTKKVVAIDASLNNLNFNNPKKSRILQIDATSKNTLDDLSDSIVTMLDAIWMMVLKNSKKVAVLH